MKWSIILSGYSASSSSSSSLGANVSCLCLTSRQVPNAVCVCGVESCIMGSVGFVWFDSKLECWCSKASIWFYAEDVDAFPGNFLSVSGHHEDQSHTTESHYDISTTSRWVWVVCISDSWGRSLLTWTHRHTRTHRVCWTMSHMSWCMSLYLERCVGFQSDVSVLRLSHQHFIS